VGVQLEWLDGCQEGETFDCLIEIVHYLNECSTVRCNVVDLFRKSVENVLAKVRILFGYRVKTRVQGLRIDGSGIKRHFRKLRNDL